MRQVDLPITSNGAYGTDITLSIQATNDKGTGYTSPTLSTTVGSIPNSPTGLVISSRPSKSSLSIAWTAETAIPNNQPTIDYRVYNLNSDCTELLISDTGSSGLALKSTLTNLTTGDNYTLVVRAVNFWGESTNSNSLQVTIGTKPSASNPPILSTSTSTSISLIIKTSSDNGGVPISSYTVYYDENQTGVFSSDTITDLSNLVWSYTGFSISALVNVKVTATNFMESDPSNLVTFVVAGVPSTPSTPTQVGVPVVKSDGTISATIAWTAPANQGSSILGYTLYYKITQSSSDYAVIYSGISRPEVLQYTVSNLTMSVQYSFIVSATNSAGEGSNSSAFVFIAAGVPSIPTNLNVVSTSTGSITLAWDPPTSDGG